jgi:hypothetical protein
MSTLAEDEYVHLKDTFRKKEAIIKNKGNQMLNLMGLLNGNANNN